MKASKLWMALVDRGANGGISGSDTRIVEDGRTGKFIDLCGIDNHTVNQVELVTCGAYVRSLQGPIILIIHQYARMPNAKTIHSCAQMEDYMVTINDKPAKVSGVTPFIQTLEGYQIPLSVLNGLVYMRMHPYTDEEFQKWPKVVVTRELPTWDPTTMDHQVPDEWYDQERKPLKLIEDSAYDEHGDYKQGVSAEDRGFKDDDNVGYDELKDELVPSNPIEVNRLDVHNYLHEAIANELVPAFRVYNVNGEIYEKDIDYRWVMESQKTKKAKSGTRKSPRGHPRSKPPSGKAPARRPIRRREKQKETQQQKDLPKYKTLDHNPFREQDEALPEEPPDPDGFNNPAKSHDTAMDTEIRAETPSKASLKTGPYIVTPAKKDYRKYEKFFAGLPMATIQKTFENTTQLGRIQGNTKHWLRRHIKAANPALNVPRRNEPVAMDTIYGPAGHPAIDNGSTMAQFFIGRKSDFRSVYPCGKSDKDVHRALADEIRKRGAMTVLVSDRARAEIGIKVLDILRTYAIDGWQSEPHNKNQNYAERGWRDTKVHSNRILERSGAPKSTWLLALEYICELLNHVARERLGWRTPIEWLLGFTPDISAFLVFKFYEPVYYMVIEPSLADTTEQLGRFVGISHNVGHSMTFKVLTESGRIIHRSILRSAAQGGPYTNLKANADAPTLAPNPRIEVLNGEPSTVLPEIERAVEDTIPDIPNKKDPQTDEIEVETVDEEDEEGTYSPRLFQTEMFPAATSETGDRTNPEAQDKSRSSTGSRADPEDEDHSGSSTTDSKDRPAQRPLDWKSRKIHSRIDEYIESGGTLPTVDVGDLMGRTFITDPQDDGEQTRAKVVGIEALAEATADNAERLYKFKCTVKDKVYEEIMTYNRMLDWVDRDIHRDDMYKFVGIQAHRLHPDPTGEKGLGYDKAEKGSYQLLIEWESGEVTWVNYKLVFQDDPITLSLYAQKNGLLNTRKWRECKKFIKNAKTMARMANQVKLRTYRNRPKYKYGVQVPRSHEEAVWIDTKNGNTHWQDAEDVEVAQLDEYDTFEDLGKGAPTPEGHKKIPCHMVYDFKHDGRYKARFVAGGHRTGTPTGSVYSGVVSLPGIRIVTAIAEMNDLEIWGTDIGNAYLESYTTEKIVFTAGPEFGEKAGHLFRVVKALYGLKASGRCWHNRLHDTLRSMKFFPSMAEEDIWMRDMGDHYEYIAVYVDDLLIASRNPKAITDTLESAPINFKLKGTGPLSFHLGCDYFRDEDGTLCYGPRKYIDRMVQAYESLFGTKPSTKYTSPLEKNDHPELDTSDLLDEDGIAQYQSLIGVLQWTITLGRFDIGTAVMTMSGFRVAPRQGHMKRIRRICGYLLRFRAACIRVRMEKPDYSGLPETNHSWLRSVYGDVRESIPKGIPKPKGKSVISTTYKDANLYHDMVTGRAVTGVLHYINKTPVDWYTRKQPTVETATYGSEFSAARTSIEQIQGLRQTLRYLGVPIDGPAYLFGDNGSVVTSSTIPDSQLGKRHHALSYHFVREAVASEMLAFYHIPGEINPSDILSKHWGSIQVWPQIKAILFWMGDTAELFDGEEPSSKVGEQ